MKKAAPNSTPTMPEAIEAAPADLLTVAAAALAGDASSAELGALLERIAAEQYAAAAEVAGFEAFETENILDASDEVLDENAAKTIAARRRANRLDKSAERLVAHRQLVEQREADADRRQRYEAAEALAREGDAWIRETYGPAAEAIGAGLAWLDEIAGALERANSDRPAGALMLRLEDFRAHTATPDSVEVTTEVYYVDDAGEVVTPNPEQPLSQDQSGAFFVGRVPRRPVFARERDVPISRPGRQRVAPRPLIAAVQLPGVVYADPDFWPRRSKLWGAS